MTHSLFAALAFAAALAPGVALAQNAALEVPFLTVRDAGSADGPSAHFGDGRGPLSAGRCLLEEVDTGGLEPLLDAGPSFLREQLLEIDEVDVMAPETLLDSVQAGWTAPPALYVHGYFIDFDKGCRRASLLQENMGLAGRMVWFTWPSDGDIANYAPDEADLYWSVFDMADAIIELNRRSGDLGGIDVIGHSLGARGVTLALSEVAQRAPDIRLGEVVLIAGDIDAEIFARFLPRISRIAEGITVYASDEDAPLGLSEQVHGYRRLGQTGNDPALLPGVEVIDVSALPSETVSGHLYHIHSPTVGSDIRRLLQEGLRAADRPGLRAAGTRLWELLP